MLWVFALVTGLIQLAAVTVRSSLGLFQEPSQLVTVADLLSLLSFLSIVVLTLTLMHQDAVPGVRQDWLIRPIKRGDLVLAKLLFVVVIVQVPLLLVDVGQGLVNGFGFSAALAAGVERNIAILCFFSLPAVLIGAVTRNIAESFVIVMVGIIAYVVVFLVGVVLLLRVRTSLAGTGLIWMVGATWYVLALTGTAVVISVQFFRRKTLLARGLIGAGSAAIILSAFVPWHTAFALQERISGPSSSAASIALTFDPRMGRFRLPLGAAAATATGLYVPLRVTGIPPGAIVLMDRASIRIIDLSGRAVYEGRSNLSVDGSGSIQDARLEIRQGHDSSAARAVYQRIFLPAPVYAKLSREPVRMKVDYSLTLFRAGKAFSLPASEGRDMLDGLGACATRIDSEGDDVQLRCQSTTRPPSCFTEYLEQPSSGLRNPETHRCSGDYSPFRATWWPEALDHFGDEIPFFDRSGLTRYPVDGSKLSDSRVVIETYEPKEHFTRQLTTAEIRLSDFTAAPARDSLGQNR
ncbi:MAG: hypothetical protein ACREU2_08540 [Steroidobacteraceae bacterium]